jgi:hypothetical protein
MLSPLLTLMKSNRLVLCGERRKPGALASRLTEHGYASLDIGPVYLPCLTSALYHCDCKQHGVSGWNRKLAPHFSYDLHTPLSDLPSPDLFSRRSDLFGTILCLRLASTF